MKYIHATLALGVCAALGACRAPSSSAIRAQEFQPQITYPSSIVVCRSKQCAPAKLSMSKEYIYNSLTHLLKQNINEKALVCQADPFTHVCTEDYVTLPITVGVTPANLYIDNVELTDVSLALSRRSIDLLLNYGISYNGQTPVCKPAQSLVYVRNTQNIVLEDGGYNCKMTTIGNTTIKTLFAIDYIDLDYGFIGGYYSIGLSGPAYGGRSGYMMFKFKNDAYPLSADLILDEPWPDSEKAALQKKQDSLNQKEIDLNKKEADLQKKDADLKQKDEDLQKKESDLKQREELVGQFIFDENGNPIYEFTDSPFEGTECYSTVLEPMPCYEEWPCYDDPAVHKMICPEPKAETFTIINDDGTKIERSKGVTTPKAINNVKENTARNTKDIQPSTNETTTMSVYDPSVSKEMKGVKYNGVEVFPIYQKKKK